MKSYKSIFKVLLTLATLFYRSSTYHINLHPKDHHKIPISSILSPTQFYNDLKFQTTNGVDVVKDLIKQTEDLLINYDEQES